MVPDLSGGRWRYDLGALCALCGAETTAEFIAGVRTGRTRGGDDASAPTLTNADGILGSVEG